MQLMAVPLFTDVTGFHLSKNMRYLLSAVVPNVNKLGNLWGHDCCYIFLFPLSRWR
jgi:hypothetical protein